MLTLKNPSIFLLGYYEVTLGSFIWDEPLKSQQSILGPRGMLFFLVIISAFPPLTTDLYLPALPQMVEIFQTNQSMVNLTLSVYFATYATGLLFWGPLSEKFGRKPILLIGIGIYIAASFLCTFSVHIEFLIFSRLLQAFGGSAVTIVSTAIVKDLYDGREREKIMATIMSLVIIAPMIAPVLGAFLLKIGSWRMMFLVLTAFGCVSFLVSLCYQETIQSRYTGSILRSWGRLGVVMKNPRLVSLLAIFSIMPMSLMAFLGAGSYIYINGFGLSETHFSYAFSFNALCASFGPTIYMRLSKRYPIKGIITISFVLLALCGLLTFFVGHLSPWLFGAIAAVSTLTGIVTRIPGTNLMLDQQDKDTGSAVAVIQFLGMMSASLGMVLVSLYPDNLIRNLGVIQLSVGVICSVLWLMVRNRHYVTDNLDKLSR